METADAVSMMRKVKGIVAADTTFGPYDVVAQVEADTWTILDGSLFVRFGRCPACRIR